MKKLLCVVLSVLMLIFVVACEKKPEETGTGVKPTGTAAKTDESGESSRQDIKDKLPENMDYGGDDINIYCRDLNGGSSEIAVPELNDEIINDAVYERQKRVEDRLKLKINLVFHGLGQNELYQNLKTSIRSNDDNMDLLNTPRYFAISLAPEGCLVNLKEYKDYIDFEAPWWSKGFMNAATIGNDKTFFLTGDASISSIINAGGLSLNTSVYEDKIGSMDDFYKLILDRKWTFDKLIEVSKQVYEDDGNGIPDDKDLYGIGQTPNAAMINNYVGLGVEICNYNSEGMPELVFNSPHTVEVAQKVNDFLYKTEGVYCPGASQEAYDSTLEKFKNSELMMIKSDISTISSYRDMSTDYTIIPFPMWDEDQGEYRSYVADYSTIWGIPVCCPDPERSAAFLTAFSSDGYRFVTPAVFESALKEAYSRDNVQGQMMDLISQTTYYDFGNLHSSRMARIEYMLPGLWATPDGNFNSSYSAKEAQYEEALKSVVDEYLNIF